MSFSSRRLFFPVLFMSLFLLTLLASGAINLHFLSDDADLPSFGKGGEVEVDKEDYMTRRAEAIAQKRGVSKDAPFDPQARPVALGQMEVQEKLVASMPRSHARDSLLAPWVPLGP